MDFFIASAMAQEASSVAPTGDVTGTLIMFGGYITGRGNA